LLGYEELCDLVDSALCRKLMQPSRLIRAADEAWRAARGARREGLGRLREALGVWRSGAFPGSPPEVKLQRRSKECGFPPAQRQVEIRDRSGRLVAKADLGIVEWKVFIECDSDEHHGPRYGSPTASASTASKPRRVGAWFPSTASTSARRRAT
jgi:hypothetical protein